MTEHEPNGTTPDSTFLTRVVIQNYRSIASCDVRLGPLTFLVGPNGSGKSNFLDALRFVSDGLRTTLGQAIRERGGIDEVICRSTDEPTNLGIRLEFRLASGERGFYALRVGRRSLGGFEVQKEEFSNIAMEDSPASSQPFGGDFLVESGSVTRFVYKLQAGPPDFMPPAVATDRLYLVSVSGYPTFRPIFDALSKMAFYSLSPDQIRNVQSPDISDILARDGSNITSVIARLAEQDENTKIRIEDYLSHVTAGIEGVDVRKLGPKEILEFRQKLPSMNASWNFLSTSMSDGTLRALGILVALFQSSSDLTPAVPFVGIEEPEVSLHPAASGVLRDALHEAAVTRQVAITSHSPDLLDASDIDDRSLLGVTMDGGSTHIGPVDSVARSVLRDRLYTAGELLRLGRLQPATALSGAKGDAVDLFERWTS